MDHDQSYKLLFSHARMVEDLLRGFVRGAWLRQVDFSTLERVNASFVSDDLREREDDVIWRLRWGPQWLYVYIVLEFQSTVDPYMAVRLLVYVGLLYQSLIRSGQLLPAGQLPPVLPVVLYNGRQRWTAVQELSNLIVTSPAGLARYQPQFSYLLLEERRYTEAELAPLHNLAGALFRLENSHTPPDVQRVLEALIMWLQAPEESALRRAFIVWLKRVLLPARLPGVAVPEVSTLEEMHTMLAEQVIEWTRQWQEEGRRQAQEELATQVPEWTRQWQEEGRRQAQAHERVLLLRQAQRRFGASTALALTPLLESIEDPERLATIGEAIVVCSSGEELLAQVRQERNG